MKLQNKQLILFDLDGTLIDSAPDLADAVNTMLKQLGLNTFSEATIRLWVGNGAHVLVKRALLGKSEIDEEIDPAVFEKALAHFFAFYTQNLAVKTVLYPGVAQTLRALFETNYTLALVTNKPHGFISPILETLQIADLFSLLIGGDTLERKKPDPSPLLHAAQTLGIDIAQCLMVGDSKNDISAANSAGMESIGVTYGYNYGEDISIYHPTLKINHFSDILAALER